MAGRGMREKALYLSFSYPLDDCFERVIKIGGGEGKKERKKRKKRKNEEREEKRKERKKKEGEGRRAARMPLKL